MADKRALLLLLTCLIVVAARFDSELDNDAPVRVFNVSVVLPKDAYLGSLVDNAASTLKPPFYIVPVQPDDATLFAADINVDIDTGRLRSAAPLSASRRNRYEFSALSINQGAAVVVVINLNVPAQVALSSTTNPFSTTPTGPSTTTTCVIIETTTEIPTDIPTTSLVVVIPVPNEEPAENQPDDVGSLHDENVECINGTTIDNVLCDLNSRLVVDEAENDKNVSDLKARTSSTDDLLATTTAYFSLSSVFLSNTKVLVITLLTTVAFLLLVLLAIVSFFCRQRSPFKRVNTTQTAKPRKPRSTNTGSTRPPKKLFNVADFSRTSSTNSLTVRATTDKSSTTVRHLCCGVSTPNRMSAASSSKFNTIDTQHSHIAPAVNDNDDDISHVANQSGGTTSRLNLSSSLDWHTQRIQQRPFTHTNDDDQLSSDLHHELARSATSVPAPFAYSDGYLSGMGISMMDNFPHLFSDAAVSASIFRSTEVERNTTSVTSQPILLRKSSAASNQLYECSANNISSELTMYNWLHLLDWKPNPASYAQVFDDLLALKN